MTINGLAILGPGSEWFWSMVSGLVLAITFIAIYRQLRLQAGAGAVEQMHAIQREWDTEVMARHRLATLVVLQGGSDTAKLPSASASKVCDYWERLGYLVRAGHISSTLVHEYNGAAARQWWALLEPAVRVWRRDLSQPHLFEHFEWLADRLAKLDSRIGAADVDRAYVVARLPVFIEVEAEAIRAAEQSRAVGSSGGATRTTRP